MSIEFREQKVEFVVSIDEIFYRITFNRSGNLAPWVMELFDVLKNKIVYLSKMDASIFPDQEFAVNVIKTFTLQDGQSES